MDKKKLNVYTWIACLFCFIVFAIFIYYAIYYLYVYCYWQHNTIKGVNVEEFQKSVNKFLLDSCISFVGAISMGFVTYVLASFLRCINKTGILTAEQLKADRDQKAEARAERKRLALEKKKEEIDKKLSAVEKKEE